MRFSNALKRELKVRRVAFSVSTTSKPSFCSDCATDRASFTAFWSELTDS